MARLLRLTRLIGLIFLPIVSSQQCYFPNGGASSDIPCNITSTSPEGTISACCGANAICLADGLCLDDNMISRGSCTDPEWGESCSQVCIEENPGYGAPLSPCDNYKYACGFDSCNSPNVTQYLFNGVGVVLRPSQIQSSFGVLVTPRSILDLEQSTNSSTSASSASSPVCSSQNNNNNKSYSAGSVAGAAVGVGAPLALALAGAIIVILRQRKQMRRMQPMREISTGRGLKELSTAERP